ncbi:MAG: uracil-DNA glycosylase family protein [Thermodesulfobacteriota bacterium]
MDAINEYNSVVDELKAKLLLLKSSGVEFLEVTRSKGSEAADLLFVAEVKERGELPKKAADLLKKMISAMGYRAGEVYVTTLPEDFTGKDSDLITAEINAVSPKIIVALGASALKALTETTEEEEEAKGELLRVGGAKITATHSLSILLKDPAKKKDTWAELQKVMAELKG